MRKNIIALFIIIVFLILSVYIPISFSPLNKGLINLLEKRLDAEIECRSLKIYIWRSLIANGVEVFGKGGFALSADNVIVDYDLVSLMTGRFHLTCNLENVKFYKSSSIINSLSDMLHIQPLGNLTFKTINAKVYVGKSDTLTQDLTLLSDKIKIFGNAITDKDDTIMCFLYFFLKDDIVDEMPKEIRNPLLQKEEGPWSSVYVGIMGDYKKPVLRIMTERFRMNISSE